MQQNKNQQLDAKFRKFIKVLIMNLVNHQIIIDSIPIFFLYIVVESMILFQMFKLDFCQVDINDVCSSIGFDDIIIERS